MQAEMLLLMPSWQAILTHLHSSPYVAAIVMLLMNMGTSFLMQDMAPIIQSVFRHVWMRRAVLFAIFFTATRNIVFSLMLTLVCTFVIDFAMNPASRFYMVPASDNDARRNRFRRNARVLFDR